ncbi:MAG: hypothetical protein ACO3VI_11155 [Ilumatobacteraceae bacterium]
MRRIAAGDERDTPAEPVDCETDEAAVGDADGVIIGKRGAGRGAGTTWSDRAERMSRVDVLVAPVLV